MPCNASETIVVVDDDPLVAEVLAALLRTTFPRVICAFTATAAADLLTSAVFRLAVVDMLMPGGRSGIDVGVDAATIGTPVLLISGSFDAVGALGQHGIRVLQKPVAGDVLCAEARRVLADGERHRAALIRAAAIMASSPERRW